MLGPDPELETAIDLRPAPLKRPPALICAWFDDAADAVVPLHDGTLATARRAADAYARQAKATNTRRAYRAGVRAWCDWCDTHALKALPAQPEDIVAFLASERGRGCSVTTIKLRSASIRYLHHLAGVPLPTQHARVTETIAGIRRAAGLAGEHPRKKAAATLAVLIRILEPIGNDLVGLRDRALLLIGFAGALRRSELAAIRVEHLEPRAGGLQLTLPRSKGVRAGTSVTIAIPTGTTAYCPVKAVYRWMGAAGIREGAVFRRVWQPPAGGGHDQTSARSQILGSRAIDPRTVARIIQMRSEAVGFDPGVLGGHSLKRGALTEGMERGVHPTRLKQHGRHKSYAVLDEYLEMGDPFDGHPLAGVL
ncbi:site-specific integrase (plasmid) [Lichenicola cladoniae]|uniref:Site-specific integrase n=1 Tax=Lichenicola cladoniae TaxID=1484109 RepID=A0A6M8HYV8_9PROT|nr:site-specific integrase [Acetobacteraceae bacterium]QKE93281.1 site-specific integrase [Lichenicola cladoniae]